MSKQLFIFRPHKDWEYCGGALVICANSFEGCQQLVNSFVEENEMRFQEFILVRNDSDSKQGVDCWVLERVYLVANNYKEEIVLHNWNEA